MKVRSYVDNYDLWLEWLTEPGDYRLDWPEHRDAFRDARIRGLLADCPAEGRDELLNVVAVVLGVPVETVRDISVFGVPVEAVRDIGGLT